MPDVVNYVVFEKGGEIPPFFFFYEFFSFSITQLIPLNKAPIKRIINGTPIIHIT